MNVLVYYGARLNYPLIKPDKNSAYSYLFTNTGSSAPTVPAKLRSALTSYISNRKSSGQLTVQLQSILISTQSVPPILTI